VVELVSSVMLSVDQGAIVPFRVNGPSVDMDAEERLVQLPLGITLLVRQHPLASGSVRPLVERAHVGDASECAPCMP